MSEDEASYGCDIETEEATVNLVRRLAPHLLPGDLLILTGGLGAGKTFATRALCHALGLDEDEPVTSPTFTLVHEYETTPRLVHADLYRLSDDEEVFELGLEVARSQGALLVVEWGAPFVEVLGGDALFLDIDLYPRRARLHGTSVRAQKVIRALLATKGPS